jgi:hypothetical protein
MALSFPLINTMTAGRYRQQGFRLLQRQELSHQTNGVLRGRVNGQPLWYARLALVKLAYDDAVDFEAMVNAHDGVVQPIRAGDLRRPYPRAYPAGSFSDSGAVGSIPSTTSLTLKSLPASFAISRGDYFMYTVGGRVRLHQVSESVTANGSGVTAAFQVRPALSANLAVDDAVAFKQPVCDMIIVPGTFDPVSDTDWTDISFDAIQTG